MGRYLDQMKLENAIHWQFAKRFQGRLSGANRMLPPKKKK